MKVDASLKKLFQRPPSRLLSIVLGEEVVIRCQLSTEAIQIENLHPDLLFELDSGEVLHVELQGYPMPNFAVRNLLHFGHVLRDLKKAPRQIVLWIADGKIGIPDGLDLEPFLRYRYELIDLRSIDARPLIESADPADAVLAVLCRYPDRRELIVRILRRLLELPLAEQKEAAIQLLVLSGLRRLGDFVRAELSRMPISIDIHENEFLEEIWQEGRQEGRQDALRDIFSRLLERQFGAIPAERASRIAAAGPDQIEEWLLRVHGSARIDDVFRD